jgi:hypothetical protein
MTKPATGGVDFRRRFRRIALFVLLLGAAAAVGLMVNSAGYKPKPIGRRFAGTVPGLGAVCLEVPLAGTNARGQSPPTEKFFFLQRTLRVPVNWDIFVPERGREGELTNGLITGSVIGEPPTFRGQWLAGKDAKPVAVELPQIAVVLVVNRKAGLKFGKFGGTKVFCGTFPEFTNPTPFQQEINRALRERVAHAEREFTSDIFRHVKDSLVVEGASWDWTMEDSIVVFDSYENIVSLDESYYEYTGGSHGHNGTWTLNFVRENGQVREFQLAELFKPGTGWEQRLSDACVADLKRQEASSVVDGKITNFVAAALGSFNVSPAGVLIHFEPYDLGGFPEGSYEVLVSWESLRLWLRPYGPARFLTVCDGLR